MKVMQISATDTYNIRQKMLRPGRQVNDCIFANDDDDQTIHLGAFIDGKLVSVASFYFNNNPQFNANVQYQLRGMATLPDHQNQGLSKELLKFGFPLIKQNFCELVWCNARTSAEGFYTKTGFESIGEVFDIPDIGPHRLMIKKFLTT